LRDLGIDVATTLEISQVASLADAAATIVGAPVLDHIPDHVVKDAEVSLIDVAPAELRARIARGRLYGPDRTAGVLDDAYAEPGLTALRELAARFLAQHLEQRVDSVLAERPGWPAITSSERVLVILDRAATRRAIRRAALLAGAERATLTAAVIETPDDATRSREDLSRLSDNSRYAADLGAEVVHYTAPDLVSGVEHVARSRRVTHLFVGYLPRAGLLGRFRPSPVDILAERLPEVELHLVNAVPTDAPGARP
jgi:two-component system sensor histidine kinase KdpD